MGLAEAKIIQASDAFLDKATYYDPREYISPDAEDFKIALASGAPHSFISAATKIPNAGPYHLCGMGYFNAVDLHTSLINHEDLISREREFGHYLLSVDGVREFLKEYTPSAQDILSLGDDISFNAAIDAIGADNLPNAYKAILGEADCRQRAELQRAMHFGR